MAKLKQPLEEGIAELKSLKARQAELEAEMNNARDRANPNTDAPRTREEREEAEDRVLELRRELRPLKAAIKTCEEELAPLLEGDMRRRIHQEDCERLEGIKAIVAALEPVVLMNLRVKEDQEGRSGKGLPAVSDTVFFPELLPSTSGHTCRLDVLEQWVQEEEKRLNGASA